jgi:hypothetical protein
MKKCKDCSKCRKGFTQKIIVVLDRSGSMDSIADDAIGGFNKFLKDQQLVPGDATLTLILFDHEYLVAYQDKPIQEAKPLTNHTFVPRGSTALYDAIGRAINSAAGDENVIVAILTDGYENASMEWRREDVFHRIQMLEKEKGWEFIYLAAGQDALKVGASMGMKAVNSFSFTKDSLGVDRAYTGMSVMTTSYRVGGGK